MKKLSVAALLAFLLLLIPACSQSQEATPAPSFELTNQFGQATSLSRLKGKVVVLTFLYTNCPDACPLLISKIQQAMTVLGSSVTEEVALVAVTVDPERDTVERLREYTSGLPFNWLYLTGEQRQLAVVWDNYDMHVEKPEEKMNIEEQSHAGHEGYEVIHTAKVVLIDREGFLRAELFMTDWQVAELTEKIRLLAEE